MQASVMSRGQPHPKYKANFKGATTARDTQENGEKHTPNERI